MVVIIVIVVVVVVVVLVVVSMALAQRLQAAEQSVAFAIGTGCEIERPGNSSTAAVSKGERPKTLNDHGLPGATFKETFEVAVLVKGHDRAASEVADQENVRVLAECDQCDSH